MRRNAGICFSNNSIDKFSTMTFLILYNHVTFFTNQHFSVNFLTPKMNTTSQK